MDSYWDLTNALKTLGRMGVELGKVSLYPESMFYQEVDLIHFWGLEI